MSVLTKESKVILAIEAIRTTKKMSIRRVAKTYDVPESSIRLRMKGTASLAERRHNRHQLNPTEEDTLVRYILDLDTRGFPPRIRGMEDIANSLLTTYHTKPLDIRWANRFVQRHLELKTRISYIYNF